jgi:tRNA-dihydrouridine synthase
MSITIYPAIDLKGGKVVRLAEGDMDRATIYGDDPVAQARAFAECGADHLHVVDLDGAFAGESVNGDVVRAIVAAFPGRVQLGGGIRTRAAIDRWLEIGVARVVIGTAALENPELVREAARDLPEPHRGRSRCARRHGRHARLGRGVGHDRRRSRQPLRRCGRRQRCCSPMSAATACSRAATSARP